MVNESWMRTARSLLSNPKKLPSFLAKSAPRREKAVGIGYSALTTFETTSVHLVGEMGTQDFSSAS